VFDLEFSEKGGLRGFFQQLGKEINTSTNQKHDTFCRRSTKHSDWATLIASVGEGVGGGGGLRGFFWNDGDIKDCSRSVGPALCFPSLSFFL